PPASATAWCACRSGWSMSRTWPPTCSRRWTPWSLRRPRPPERADPGLQARCQAHSASDAIPLGSGFVLWTPRKDDDGRSNLAHQSGEAVEQIQAVRRPRRRLGVVLNAEDRLFLDRDAAVGAVEQADVGFGH